jgi:polyisoprenoid-binding protein YceI
VQNLLGNKGNMKYTVSENSRVDFTAQAPMHTFKGWAVEGMKGEIEIDFDSLELQHIKVSVEANCFDTGDADKNKAMKDFFVLKSHPEASFVMSECQEFCKMAGGNYKMTVLGILEFAGIRRQLPITCMVKRNDKQVLIDLQFKWSFKAYGMKAPRLLFMTVRDIVDIKAHLEFTTV